MTFEEEVVIDEEVKDALDQHLLAWEDVTSGNEKGAVSYLVKARPFVLLMEGVAAVRLPDDSRSRALKMARLSPFRSSPGDEGADEWVQLVLVFSEDAPALVPLLEASFTYVASHS